MRSHLLEVWQRNQIADLEVFDDAADCLNNRGVGFAASWIATPVTSTGSEQQDVKPSISASRQSAKSGRD